jgi:phosphatidylglycerophosphatase A
MKTVKIWAGTLFGAGLLPAAPGTWGSFFTLPLIYLASWLHPGIGLMVFLIITIFLSLWSAPENVRQFGDDPPQFVMDESAGQTVVFLTAGFAYSISEDWIILLGGFVLFRIFDVLKPLGIKALEKISGKYGILLDDLLAGVYALICLEIIMLLIVHLL